MGSKLFKPELTVLHYEYSFLENPQAAVGVVDLGHLPEDFVVQSVSVRQDSALTATTTVKVGPTVDDDGYLVAVDPAAIQRGAGALLYDAADKHYNEAVVGVDQKLLVTTAVAACVTGKLSVYVQGYQS
jgi:hypothetical protein